MICYICKNGFTLNLWYVRTTLFGVGCKVWTKMKILLVSRKNSFRSYPRTSSSHGSATPHILCRIASTHIVSLLAANIMAPSETVLVVLFGIFGWKLCCDPCTISIYVGITLYLGSCIIISDLISCTMQSFQGFESKFVVL